MFRQLFNATLLDLDKTFASQGKAELVKVMLGPELVQGRHQRHQQADVAPEISQKLKVQPPRAGTRAVPAATVAKKKATPTSQTSLKIPGALPLNTVEVTESREVKH